MEGLGINIVNTVIYIILFGILYLLLDKYFLKKLFAVVDERRSKITEGLEYTEEAREKLKKSDEEYKKIIEKAKAEAKEIKEEAKKLSDFERKETIEAAKTEATGIIERANRRFEEYRREYQKEVEQEVRTKANELVKKIVGHDPELNKEVIDKYISEL